MRTLRAIYLSVFACLVGLALEGATHIRVNQLGYLPGQSKVAVLVSNELAEVDTFRVMDVFTGRCVFTGQAASYGELGDFKATYRLNFSGVTSESAYKIEAAGAESSIFPINARVYDGAADFTLNYMRQQRCGYNPFIHDSCHVKDAYVRYHPVLEGQRIDVTGGWHDAADLLQYTSTSANAIYQMMLAYEQNPSAFGDAYDARGERGANGIPDIVDEIYWGLQWLSKMNPAPGELYNQIADDRDHIGMKLPNNDIADYGWGRNNGRPVYFVDGRPQQRGKYLNATMGAASTAGKFASDFAMGARILAPFYPDFAQKIAAKSAPALQVGLDKPGNTQTVSVVSPYIYEEDNWTDDMELGAVELFRSTADSSYLTLAVEMGRREPITPWMGADSARHYQWYPFMNMGHVRLAQMAGGKVRAEFLRNLRSGIERVRERGLENPFLNGVPGIWCSNNLTVALLTQCILYRTTSGDTQFLEFEGALRDWLFGCNPWGTSMIVELPFGGTYPLDPHSNYVVEGLGNTTGGLVDGPVYSTIFNSLKGVNITISEGDNANNYDHCQPGYVVYHDNRHDYSTNEPTMDGTASLTFPLSFYQNEGGLSSSRHVAEPEGAIVRGNPAEKKICLVFTADDRADGADTIISTLHRQEVKGAFFFTGRFYEMYPDVVRRLLANGHYVGSHSYGHLLYAPWDKRDSLLVSHDEFVADMVKSYEIMRPFGITQASSPFFIPPYEWYNRHIASWARELGLQVINFTPGTYTNNDYSWPQMGEHYSSNKSLEDRLFDYELKHTLNGHILMVHLGTDPRRTEKFYDLLPRIITTLRECGYSFVPLTEVLR